MTARVSTDKWVALLRGVNVGGGNKVPMADLRALCIDLGWQDVRSYIASGNLVFGAKGQAAELAKALRIALADGLSVNVPVLVLPGDRVRRALRDCPFDPEKGSLVHAVFTWDIARLDLALFERLKAPGDALVPGDGIIWLHTPGGFGSSKVAGALPRIITGTEMTARNLNTLRKLSEWLDG